MKARREQMTNAPRLWFNAVEHDGQRGVRVTDTFAGLIYTCVAGRGSDGRLGLTYLAVTVDGGRLLDDLEVQQVHLDRRQLAVWADRFALDGALPREGVSTVTWGPDDDATSPNPALVVAQFAPRVRGAHRETPSLKWVADLIRECEATGAPYRETVAALADVNVSTVGRWRDRAIDAGLLERRAPGRPRKNPTTPKEPT